MNTKGKLLHQVLRPKYLFHRIMALIMCIMLGKMRRPGAPAVVFYISGRPIHLIVFVFAGLFIFMTLAIRDDLEIIWNGIRGLLAEIKEYDDED